MLKIDLPQSMEQIRQQRRFMGVVKKEMQNTDGTEGDAGRDGSNPK